MQFPASSRIVRIAPLFGALVLISATGLAAAAPPPGVTVTDPWFRFVTPQVPAGGYMTLHNSSARPAVLTAADSSACGMVMMHRSEASGSSERMVAVGSVTVPPSSSVAFAPGSYHLMCMKPRMTAGGRVPVTLHFQDGTAIDTDFPVLGATGHSPHTEN
jgi:hypothetical protein